MTDNRHFALLPRLIATTLGCGYWPWGPGTAGAIFGMLVWMPLALIPSTATVVLITVGLIVVFTALGIWSAGVAERYWGPDPSRVVIDETVGQWITMLPMASLAGSSLACGRLWTAAALSLILFRFFDIVKPLGVRRMEQLPRGTGIMADDILAGVYGAIILQLIITFAF
ncbi:MAG: phosphatidylglycerophosphatase A [Bacteroidales bacterium]|nr:phosphatidylglycerophosphatase A [Bacteroidales bacterium]